MITPDEFLIWLEVFDVKFGPSPGGIVDSIIGTANQVIASSPTGNVTLSLPQSIATSSSPTFAGLTLGTSVLTLGGSLTTSGAFASTFTMTGPTSVTFPTSGTLSTTVGTVTSVSGSTNRITSTGGTTPVIDISAAYVGQTSITTLGTITTGVWNGTTIAAANGGSGVASPTAHGILIAEGASPFTPIVLTAGQILIGTTASDPAAATLTAGTGISISSITGSITISSNGGGLWVDETGASVTMATNTGYTSDDGATLVTFTLPTTSAIGDFVEINGKGAGLWTIAQATGQQIHISTVATTSGASGSLSSVNQYDNVRLRCLTANTIWTVVNQQSTGLTVV